VQSHVVEAFDVRQIVLPDGKSELRLVDLHPRGVESVQETQRVAEAVAPAPVPQFDRDGIAGEAAEQVRQVGLRLGCVLEAGRKLREQRAELACRCQRIDAAPKLVEVRVVGPRERVQRRRFAADLLRKAGRNAALEHRGVRELLIQLDGELEIARCPIRPSTADIGARLAVESRVDLNRVEVLGVKGELVKTLRPAAASRIEDAVPGPLA
jgi:hypothetical protein